MARAAFAELLRLAGLPDAAAAHAEIRGADPVLPIRYRVGTAGAAALAALGLAAARLWALKSGRMQRVAVDVRAATVSLRSAHYLRINGKPLPAAWDPMSGFYPVRDGGWVSIHCNFPHHRDAALAVLGVGEDRALAEAASREWEGGKLEEAVHARGGCAGLVRSAAQWSEHPQAQAVALQPLLEITRIGDAPPEPLPSGDRPLAGIRALDLTRVLAGPTCGRCLAEHGADVLKINGPHLPDSGGVELDTGVGKLSAHLDLRSPQGTDTLRGLVRESDVFSQSYRPGTLGARGFSPEALAALRPGIVCVSLSAWGGSGPWSSRRGFDSIVQAVSGIAQATGDATKPRLLPMAAIDYTTGYLMAFGTMVALERRALEGGSWLVRAGLARTAKWIVDRGEVAQADCAGLPAELPGEELQKLFTECDAPDGRIRHLGPIVQLSDTPGRWARPPVPLGHHRPEWPAR